MHRSFKIFTVAGIPVKVHWTFILLPVLLWYMVRIYHFNERQTLWIGLAIAAMLVCILLHEFGHALMARRLNVQTIDILLLPIGGLARLENLPAKAIHEFWIALAGPAVNILIALLCIPYLILVTAPRLAGIEIITAELILTDLVFFPPFVFAMNLGLATFNLLPAFPMDGGRVLRSLLATKIGHYKATKLAAITGQIIAVAMFTYGLIDCKIPYIFIAAFVFIAAQREHNWTRRQQLLNQKISDVFAKPESKEPSPALQSRAEFTLATIPQDSLKSWGTIEYNTTLEIALTKLYETKMPALLVMEEGQALGLIHLDQIEEWLNRAQSRFDLTLLNP